MHTLQKVPAMDLTDLLTMALARQASDLHLAAGMPPMLRVQGLIEALDWPVLDQTEVAALLSQIMSAQQREVFAQTLELDLAWTHAALGRFRVNAFMQNRGAAAVFRSIPATVPALASLGAPAVLAELALRPRGLVLVTGPTGSGKSTTLAAMVDVYNRTRAGHILTVEDPIEFEHMAHKCIVNQRELGRHTHSFSAALRAALREDPDVVMVGELRDLNTIRLALTAAETGHLVLGTLHTASAAKAVARVADVSGEDAVKIAGDFAGMSSGVAKWAAEPIDKSLLAEVQAILMLHFDGDPINDQNLTNWRQGGYLEWCAQQAEADVHRRRVLVRPLEAGAARRGARRAAGRRDAGERRARGAAQSARRRRGRGNARRLEGGRGARACACLG